MKILAISDLHGNLPDVPPCDLLLLGGDICPDYESGGYGQTRWLHREFLPWISKQPVGQWYGTWGNHDFIDETPYNFKVDEQVEFDGLKIWLTPWSNQFGNWHWMADPDSLGRMYSAIPEDIDILVSHQPPYAFGDKVGPRFARVGEDPHVGSHELVDTIKRVKPKFVICGHIHEGFGVYRFIDGDQTIFIQNVAHVDDRYQPVHPPQEILI